MAVNKVIELMSESDKGWEDAAQKAVAKASKSIKGIRSAWIQDMSATVNGKGKLDSFRITCKLAFEVKG
jgi:flavin-binding protein dodecin